MDFSPPTQPKIIHPTNFMPEDANFFHVEFTVLVPCSKRRVLCNTH